MENTVVVVRSDEEILNNAEEAKEVQRKDVFQVDPLLLTVEEGHNVRDFDSPRVKEHIESLATNILENGVLTPLICRKGTIGKDKDGKAIYKYIIIDGECRFRATQLANQMQSGKIHRVPVILETKGSDKIDRVLDMLNANESLRFTPMELASAYGRFIRLGLDEKEIAKRVGKGLNHVKDTLALLDTDQFDDSVIEAVKTNQISANSARRLKKQIKEEGVDDHLQKKVQKERLEKAFEVAEKNERQSGKKLNISKYLDINDPTEKPEKRVEKAIELIIKTVGEKRDFTRAHLKNLLEDLKAGLSIQNAINHVFSTPLLDNEMNDIGDTYFDNIDEEREAVGA